MSLQKKNSTKTCALSEGHPSSKKLPLQKAKGNQFWEANHSPSASDSKLAQYTGLKGSLLSSMMLKQHHLETWPNKFWKNHKKVCFLQKLTPKMASFTALIWCFKKCIHLMAWPLPVAQLPKGSAAGIDKGRTTWPSDICSFRNSHDDHVVMKQPPKQHSLV